MLNLAGRRGVFALRSVPAFVTRRGLASSSAVRDVGAQDDEAAPAPEQFSMTKGGGADATTVEQRNKEYLARTMPKTPREAVDRKLDKRQWIRPRINPSVLLHGKDSVAPESVYEFPYRPFRLKDFSSIQSIIDVPDPILDNVIRTKIEPTMHVPKTGHFALHNVDPDTNGPMLRRHGRPAAQDQTDEIASKISESTPLTLEEVEDLHRYTVTVKRVVHQSHKGRVASFYVMVIVGNGRGLVGYGQGNAPVPREAAQAALIQASKSMDFIERFEGRTIPMEYSHKFSATKVVMRPRPAGFGLRVPPSLHSFCRAAGIQDLSAEIIGSPNPMNVVKCAAQMLFGGHNPIAFGNAYGRAGSRMKRGAAMPSVRSLELNRGRRLISAR